MAVTAPQLKSRRDGCRINYPVTNAVVIYENTLVYLTAAGYATNVIAAGANKFVGIATRTVDNSAGAAGAVSCEVESEGDFEFVGADFAQANVGDNLYGVDNFTTSLTATAQSYVGEITEYISATKVRAKINARTTQPQVGALSGAGAELTIDTGAITVTGNWHTVDTEADAASDDLDTISGTVAGQIVVLQAANGARSVVAKDGTGNLKLGGDRTLDNAEDTLTLVSDGTNLYELAFASNGA